MLVRLGGVKVGRVEKSSTVLRRTAERLAAVDASVSRRTIRVGILLLFDYTQVVCGYKRNEKINCLAATTLTAMYRTLFFHSFISPVAPNFVKVFLDSWHLCLDKTSKPAAKPVKVVMLTLTARHHRDMLRSWLKAPNNIATVRVNAKLTYLHHVSKGAY